MTTTRVILQRRLPCVRHTPRRPTRVPPWWSVALAAFILTCALGIRARGVNDLLQGSEVDYTLAARRGLLANYLDQGSRPLGEYLAAAKDIAGLAPAADNTTSTPDLWQRDVVAGDIAAYRHYHPPLLMYMLHGAERLLGPGEFALRLVPLLLSVATLGVLYAGCAIVLPIGGHRVGLVAAAILSLLPLHVETSTDIGWHTPYAALAATALFSTGFFLVRPSTPALVTATVLTSLAFALLEHGLFLFVTLTAAVLNATRTSLNGMPPCLTRRSALTIVVAVAALTLIAVWPASLLKLSLVKNLGVNAYYSRTLELSPRVYDVYVTLMSRYPMTFALAVATLAAMGSRRVRLPAAILPFAVYAAAMVLLQVGNTNLKPLYYVSLQPALAVLSAYCLVDVLDRMDRRRMLAAMLLGVLTCAAATSAWRAWSRPRSQPPLARLVQTLSAGGEFASERVLTLPPGSHLAQALTFYVPGTRFVRVVDEPPSRRRAAEAIGRGAFRFVIVEGSGRGFSGAFASLAAYERVAQITDVTGRLRYQVLRRPDD